MDAIMNVYKQDDLTTAARLIQDALSSSPGNDTLLYFQAVVTERGGDHRSATKQFQAVPPRSVFSDRAVYQLALMRLRSGDRAQAKALLERMRRSTYAPVADRAERLLERL
jgi:Tfp pilus assembly protein PilF